MGIAAMIFALETGLSSDPAMNRRISALDRFALVSNSDAHSPSKIGREANVFDTDFSYRGFVEALRANDPARFLYTVEFFPEEGKYHYDGHRKCGICLSPEEARGTLRFSFGWTTRPEEIDRLLAVVPRVWARAAPVRPGGRPPGESAPPAFHIY